MSLLELGLVILGEGGTDGIYVKSWIACTKQNCTVSTKFKYKSHGLLLLYTCDTRCGIHDGRKAEKLSLANPALTRLPGLCAYLCSSLIPLWASCACGGNWAPPTCSNVCKALPAYHVTSSGTHTSRGFSLFLIRVLFLAITFTNDHAWSSVVGENYLCD